MGAGSAGCALTYELARRAPGCSILLLEAGGRDNSPFIRVPAGQLKAIGAHDWGYSSQPDPSRDGASEPWQRGRVIGGSSSINGTMYVRGARSDFDRWASELGPANSMGWTADEVWPVFQEMESCDQAGDDRGHSGRLHVRTVRHPHPATRAFVTSAVEAGHPLNPDYNSRQQAGIGFAQLNQKGWFRCSAAQAFLKPAQRLGNVEILTDAKVARLQFAAGRARAVEFTHAGRQRSEAAREVVLCGGAINSPQLLMLSGIGAADELTRVGVQPILDLPGVGRNLQDHPLLKFIYRMRTPTNNLTGGWKQKIDIGFKYVAQHEGPLANIFEAGAFLKTSPNLADPDIQLHFTPAGYTAENGEFKLLSYPAVTVLLNKSHPLSRGRIRLASANPADAPLIEARLIEHPADVATLVRGIGLVREIMARPPISDLVEAEIAPGADIRSNDDLVRHVRRYTGIAYHPVGTCRMGLDSEAVVGPDLRVHGTENLWIADASIVPDLPSGNTNAVCMMIGLKLGRHLAERAQPHAS